MRTAEAAQGGMGMDRLFIEIIEVKDFPSTLQFERG